MGEPDRLLRPGKGAFRKIRIDRPAEDRHALEIGDSCLVAADTITDETAHGGAGQNDRLAARFFGRIGNQRRDIGNAVLIEGAHARRIIGAAIGDGQIFQPVEIAAEGVVVHTEPPVAPAPMDEDDRESLPARQPDAADLKRPALDGHCFQRLRLLRRHIDILPFHPALGHLVAAVDIAHFLIVDDLGSAAIAAGKHRLGGKQLILERAQRPVSGKGRNRHGRNSQAEKSTKREMSCGHALANRSFVAARLAIATSPAQSSCCETLTQSWHRMRRACQTDPLQIGREPRLAL